MTIQLKTNSSASAAAFHLARNTQNLQKSLNRLASGSRIIQPADDTGGLAVSMKLQSSISRLEGAGHNVQNGISYLEVQDGILASAGRIVDRMIELKGMSQDMMKNDFDNATYENEFKDLQIQLYDMTQQTFNGVSLFAHEQKLVGREFSLPLPQPRGLHRITRFRCLLVRMEARVRRLV